MKVVFLCVALIVLASSAEAKWPLIWPMPKSYSNGTGTVVLNAMQFRLSSRSTPNVPGLDEAVAIFKKYTFLRNIPNTPGEYNSIVITVRDLNPTFQQGLNETYRLSVTASKGFYLDADNYYGVVLGLQTLSQIIQFDHKNNYYCVKNAPWLIEDKPRFPFRAVLVDSARHFLPLPTLKRIIDSLSYAKFNVLHWHLTDAQAFPFDAPSHPQLAAKGAYSDQEKYSLLDITEVVEYARKRAVRIMMELDVPGHFGGWCAGAPEVCLSPQCSSSNVNDYPMNVASDAAYTTVDAVLKDLTSVLPEVFFHMGGDQPATDCWNNNSAVKSWMNSKGYNGDDAYIYAVKKIHTMLAKYGKTPVGWHETWDYFGTSLPKAAVIIQRKSTLSSNIAMNQDITSKKYRLVFGDQGRWYLDHLTVTWQTMYTAEPCQQLSSSQCSYVIGGEACMWGETVDTSDIIQTMWPKAAAAAERLWSPSTVTDTTAAAVRLAAFRCTLMQRGIAASPLTGTSARGSPSGPGSCYAQ